MDSNSLPLSNLSPAQRKAFNGHLNDMWDDYQDELARPHHRSQDDGAQQPLLRR